MSEKRNDVFCVLFTGTGQRFSIRWMNTSDQYEVELPAGTYSGDLLRDLAKVLKKEFNGVKIVQADAVSP